MEKDLVIREMLEHEGLMDFKGFYNFMYNWLKSEGFTVYEDEYVEKVSGEFKELRIKWKVSKQLSDYFKVEYNIKTEVRRMSDVEVEIEGKKKKMQKALMEMDFKGSLVKDVDSGWEGHSWLRFMREIYDKYVIPKRIFDLKQRIEDDLKELRNQLKRY